MITATAVLEQVGRTPHVVACVTGPIDARGRARAVSDAIVAALRETSAARDGRLVLTPARQWSVRVAMESCESEVTETVANVVERR